MQRVNYIVLEILKIKFSTRRLSWEKKQKNHHCLITSRKKHSSLDIS